MNHLLTNVAKFYSKLDQFRADGEFTDVIIECEDGTNFRCHRLVLVAASDYFHTMFCGKFKERTSEKVDLGECNSATFQEVLKFIYTGDMQIDCTNVFNLLRASEFLMLPDIGDVCVSFIKENKSKFTVQLFLNIYLYACATNKDALTDILKPHLVDQFEIFSKADEFLEMPLDVLTPVISSRLSSSTLRNADEIVLSTVMRWVYHHREERLPHLNRLAQLTVIQNISAEFWLANLPTSAADVAVLPRFTSPIGLMEVPQLQRTKFLHVYVKYEPENLIRIFSINSSKSCSLSKEIFVSDPHQNFCIVPFDDFFMYRMNYSQDCKEQTFYAHTSADMQLTLELKRPPLLFERVNLCPMRNNIYAYNETLNQSVTRTNFMPNSRAFNDEEIVRGIYAYNCEVNDWFPVPEMLNKSENSSMTCLNNSLYLIGGTQFRNCAQALDYREARWRQLRPTTNNYIGAACCVLNNKIYICGGEYTNSCERYDPAADKWEDVCNLKSMSNKAVKYGNSIWLFNGSLMSQNKNLNFVQIIDSGQEQASDYSHLVESMNMISQKPTNIIACLVFEKV